MANQKCVYIEELKHWRVRISFISQGAALYFMMASQNTFGFEAKYFWRLVNGRGEDRKEMSSNFGTLSKQDM